mgnify:CR=1 FL=1
MVDTPGHADFGGEVCTYEGCFKQFLLKYGVNDVNIYETEADVVDKPLVSICQKKLL